MKKYSMENIVDLLNAEFPTREIDYDTICDFANSYDLCFDSGETRYCLFQPHWDKVLKIPRFDNVEDDYGAIEVANYNRACDLGINRIFLWTAFLTTLDSGCPIYVQTKFSTDHANMNSYRKLEKLTPNCLRHKICEIARDGMYQSHRINRLWFARAYQIYGKRFMRIVEEFTKEYRIGDLHAHNLGWLGKQPIILDFAGYHG